MTSLHDFMILPSMILLNQFFCKIMEGKIIKKADAPKRKQIGKSSRPQSLIG